jgi:acyl carrier protein
MISELEVKSLLKNEIAGRIDLPADSIDENAHLADLGVDSLQALQLLVVLERSFGITLNDDDLQYFRDIKTLGNLVASRIQERAGGGGVQ